MQVTHLQLHLPVRPLPSPKKAAAHALARAVVEMDATLANRVNAQKAQAVATVAVIAAHAGKVVQTAAMRVAMRVAVRAVTKAAADAMVAVAVASAMNVTATRRVSA